MELTGKIIETKTKSGTSKAGKEWKSKQVIIEYADGMYTQNAAFELFGEENIEKYPCRKGQTVTVYFNINAREYNGNWYTSLDAWKIATGNQSNDAVEPTFKESDQLSDLPF